MANTLNDGYMNAVSPSINVAKNVVIGYCRRKLKEIEDMESLVARHYIEERRSLIKLLELLEDMII